MKRNKFILNKKIAFLFCLVIYTILLYSCESPRSTIAPLSRSEVVSMQNNNYVDNNDVKINIKELNEEWSIALEENLTTGYQWELAFEGDGQIDVINSEFITPTGLPEGLLGAPGSHVWTFKAVKKGTVIMRLQYLRPWDKTDIQETKTYIFNIV